MKFILLLMSLSATLVLTSGCSSKTDAPPPTTAETPNMDELAALNDIQVAIISRFNVYNELLDLSAKQLAAANMQGAAAVSSIQSLADSVSAIRLAGSAGLDGNPQIIYPKIFLSQEGTPTGLSQDLKAAVSQLRTGARVLGGARRSETGAMLVTYMTPVKGKDQIVIGVVFIQIAADEMLRRIVIPEINGMTINIWVMQTDGLILYDTNPDEIGMNVLTQDPFIKYPSLVECARRIAANPTGSGHYTYVTKGGKQQQSKSAQWTTFARGGRQWRIILNLEDRAAQ